MFNIEIEVEDNLSEIFDGFVSNFHLIANNIRKVAKFIEQKTEDKVPLDTGLLEASFDYHIVDENSNFVEVEMGYYAISPKNNFQYALVQHEKNFLHPIRGERYYLKNSVDENKEGMFVMMQTDFLSLFSQH